MKESKTKCESCSICGSVHTEDLLTKFEGEQLCPECLARETLVCSCCGKRIWFVNNSGTFSLPLCSSCYDEYYTSCVECGRIIHREDAYYDDGSDEPLCYRCHENNRGHDYIEDYYYKPEPIFYGIGKRFFGVELEVDCGGECDDNAAAVMRIGNGSGLEHIYCKHDGSLDEGFEIVTHPMTIDYHLKEMPWKNVLTRLKTLHYLSHQAGTCGLHIHVNRTSLGETYEDQEETIARILYFFEKNWDELLKFSRRTNHQLQQWAARYGYKDKPKEILDHAKNGGNNGRYSCINLYNSNTIEFRMFRGTLKLNTIIATLQLVNKICDVAYSLSDEEIKNMSWTTFVSGCEEPELIEYLKERRIYVNEPIDTEEEI
ncbi:MAG: amidoligase family protein [Clostridia bacterium]|nr:amidoligase family protein [Clostridia bacterium]